MDSKQTLHGDDSALIPSAELGAYYDRRFYSFEGECTEHVERIGERRLALRVHHEDLRKVEILRKKVGQLQYQLAEVEVQSAKERVRALRLDSEHKDLHISRREHKDEIRRLLAARRAQVSTLPTGPQGKGGNSNEGSSLPGASQSLLRLVETPGGGEDLEAPADLWLKIRAEVMDLTHDLSAFDSGRAERTQKHSQEVALLEAELEIELTGLEGERERLADAMLGYVQLRSQHVAAQRKHAMEMEVLKSCNRELMTRAQELASKGKQKVEEVECLYKKDVEEHIEYRRSTEMLERQQVGVAKACLEDVCETGEARMGELANETKALKERCAASRRRRKLALDGLRADLSLVAKKLAVLEDVAEQVGSSVAQACRGAEGGDGLLFHAGGAAQPSAGSRTVASAYGRQPLQALEPDQPTVSPYGQRAVASPFARPPQKATQRCRNASRGALRLSNTLRSRGVVSR